MLCDIQEFDLHHETASFCQHLQNIQINYREKKLLCIDLIQTTTKRKRNRQKSKRVTRSLDHCIFCEIFFEIRDFFFCFVCFFFVAISLVSELLRVFLVFDSFIATQSISNLQKSRLQTLREDLRIKQQISRARTSTSCEKNN